MDPDTGEPKDELLPQAAKQISALGCELTKPSEVAEQKVEVIMKKIQEGLDEANEKAVSRAQKVRERSVCVRICACVRACVID